MYLVLHILSPGFGGKALRGVALFNVQLLYFGLWHILYYCGVLHERPVH